jgi:hypothetical protein
MASVGPDADGGGSSRVKRQIITAVTVVEPRSSASTGGDRETAAHRTQGPGAGR